MLATLCISLAAALTLPLWTGGQSLDDLARRFGIPPAGGSSNLPTANGADGAEIDAFAANPDPQAIDLSDDDVHRMFE